MRSRYAVLVEKGRIEIQEEEIACGEDELLIHVSHCGVCQYDGAYFKGAIGTPPLRLGHEPVGTVQEVGRNVTGFAEGDRVTGLFGHLTSFADFVAADPTRVIKVPDAVPSAHALAEPLKCIVTILRTVPIEFGDHVLVMGCGFMGLLVIAGLTGAAPRSIIAVDVRRDRLDLARAVGATHCVDARDDSFFDRVREITGDGAEVVIEVAGNAPAVEQAAKTLKRRGRFALAGWHGVPGTYTLRNWTTRGATIYSAHPASAIEPMEDAERGIRALERGVFPMGTLLTHTFALEDIQRAFDTMAEQPPGYVKAVVVP